MPITLITAPANAGKAQLVMQELRSQLARGEEPLLIVPTRADAEHYLRELAGDGAVLGARVERFRGLIEEVVGRAGLRAQTLGPLARERAIAAIAAQGAHRHAGAGFVRALSDVLAELHVRRVTPARLHAALAEWATQDGPTAARTELGDLFAAYRQTLERIGRSDGEQRAVRALDALRRTPALWGRTPVLFYGFDDLTRLQLDTIETLGTVIDAPVTVSLTFEAGRTAFAGRAATFHALEPIAAEHRKLPPRSDYYAPHARAALSHLERSLFEPGAPRVDPQGHVRLLEGGGERAELELVAREIARLLDGGMKADEIAIVARTPGASSELLEEILTEASIPFALQQRKPFAHSALGRALLGLLRCVPTGGDGHNDGEDAPIAAGHTTGMGEGELADLLAWLRAPGLLERPELADTLELSALRTGVRSTAAARELWERRNWTLDTLDQIQQAARRGPGALIDRVLRELHWLFLAPRRGVARVLGPEEAEEARALAAARSALAELRELARIAADLAPSDPLELARALETVEFFSGTRPSAAAVAVLDPLALRARRVRALFVCGLQEGVFPARARAQPFLAEEERRRLAETSGLRLDEQRDALAAERYLLYAAVSRAEELLYLSWHVCDDDGQPAARSLFVDDICDLFHASLAESCERRPLGAAEPNPHAPKGTPFEVQQTLADPEVLEALREYVWSASSFQAWIGCPVRWFVERILRPGAIDPDAEPLARGGLAHEALKDTLEGLRQQTGSARVTLANLPLARQLLADALAANEAKFPLSVAPERRPGARRRLHSDLQRYLRHAAEQECTLEPSMLELGFGFAAHDDRGEASELPVFDLGGGVRMRGRIDRVDAAPDGSAVVVDYKSSVAPAPAKWIGERNLQVALYMHAVEDLLAVNVVGGFYQPLSGADLRARGVLDEDSSVTLDCVRGDARSHDAMRELLDEALEAARRAAAEAASGKLEARPTTCAYAGGCMYPTICRCNP